MQEHADEKDLQREIENLKKKLRRAQRNQTPSSFDVSSNNEGLYNGVKPPEENTREKKKEQEGRVTVAFGRTQPEENHFI